MDVPTGADTGRTFALEDEDHTLANALRFLLNKKWVFFFLDIMLLHTNSSVQPWAVACTLTGLHACMRSPHVSFVGYSIPHPSEAVVNLRIQTTGMVHVHVLAIAQCFQQGVARYCACACMLHVLAIAQCVSTGGSSCA